MNVGTSFLPSQLPLMLGLVRQGAIRTQFATVSVGARITWSSNTVASRIACGEASVSQPLNWGAPTLSNRINFKKGSQG